MADQSPPDQNLSLGRNFKIGTFHIGSSMADVLAAGVWNRVMIQDLGYAATPVGFLLALRYFLVPLAVWAGERSDYTNLWGYRRLPWIWGGRAAMILGYVLIALSTVELTRYGSHWWFGLVLGFIIASVGYSVSGSTFLALIYDRSPQHQRGRAVGIVWTLLLAGYAFSGILFGRLLPDYTESGFVALFVGVGALMALIWGFATWGEEKPQTDRAQNQSRAPKSNFREDLAGLLQQRSSRLLAGFILLSFSAGFMQDALLEPFGGAVFGLSTGQTTRFQAYWGGMAILFSLLALWARHKYPSWTHQRLTAWGVVLMGGSFGLLGLIAFTEIEALLRPSLFLLGIGYGLWNIGTLGLMVANSRESNAGLDLGVWTMVATVCRGGGILAGGVLFDLFRWGSGETATAYGLVFTLAGGVLFASLGVLNQMAQAETSTYPAAKREGELILSSSLD